MPTTIISAAAGNLLICCSAVNSTVAVPTDNLGGTFVIQGTKAAGFCDLAVYAKVAAGGETTVTGNQATATTGNTIVMELHSDNGAFTLTNIYANNKTTNTASSGGIYTGGAVTVAALLDWVIGFLGVETGVTGPTQDSPWTTTETNVSGASTPTVWLANATRTGVTGSQAPLWTSGTTTTNISSVVIAVSDVAAAAAGLPNVTMAQIGS